VTKGLHVNVFAPFESVPTAGGQEVNINMAEKGCFGQLNQVFPMGREGLREVTSSCFGCSELKACLEAALSTRQGLSLRLEALDRGGPVGIVGRVKHWSERKELVRRMKAKEEK
jgi:hypothetical protein